MGIVKTAKEIALEARQAAERAAADSYRQEGLLEYVAMMADVELPEGEEGGSDDE